ncbi:helix-turn-helix domain-containing protein [Streptomyces phaeochromogenes]|uniref:helix-turn-helix domain-containing protein n=1 Tax=Streptomyces phaeochromogenes TaxID=1923 RepID=UPI00338F9408
MTPNGAAIRAFRGVRGYSARRLADLTERSPSTITRIEGEERGASRVTLDRIAAALDIPVEAITREKP